MTPQEERAASLAEFSADRWLAHATLFAHRHRDPSPPAHVDLVNAINRPIPHLGIEGYRGFAKSSYLEETGCIRAGFREFHNMVVVGSSYARAVERLASIKREIDINEKLHMVFGKMRGNVWQEGKIVLTSGACIQALGRDQSTTGMKHLDWRPDAALIDDVEDPEAPQTDIERDATWAWFLQTFLPSLDDSLYSWVRVLGTRRGNGSLIERLEAAGWPVVKFPIEYPDKETGERRATWPSKDPLEKIDAMKRTYAGRMDIWNQEYMCMPSSEVDRVFRREMFRVEPRVRTWEATYAFIDPARSTGRNSAASGWAVWSWLQNRLIVWAAGDPMLLPDEIIALAFDLTERFDPIWLGIERTGLEQWLEQPMRHEQARRGITIPYKGIQAVSQIGLISGLQPFFSAREVIFAQPLPALEAQLLSFPHGRRDTANALAYAPTMRPSAPIYDGFMPDHIVETAEFSRGRPLYIAANATAAMVTAVLLQVVDGRVTILGDWVREGTAHERVPDVAVEAALVSELTHTVRVVDRPREWAEMLKAAVPDSFQTRRTAPIWVVPPIHAERYTNVGLIQAVKAVPAEVRTGGTEVAGQSYFRDALSRTARGVPAVEVAANARWTLRALSGGYTRAMARGRLQEHAEEGPYRVLMEGLEAFFGMVRVLDAREDEDDEERNFKYDAQGRRYLSAMPARERR